MLAPLPRFDLPAWYAGLRAAGRPLAWCSAFAPAEALLALGVLPVYPENHAAWLGSGEAGAPALAAATAAGYAGPRLCTYALADLGVLAGAPGPIPGGLPGPDLLYACDSQCAVVGRWGAEVQRRRGPDLPAYLLHAPPCPGPRPEPAAVAAFRRDLDAQLADIARRFRLRSDPARLAAVLAESAAANRLWRRCLAFGRLRPAPWTFWDACTAMAPIVVARGHPACTAYYRALHAALAARAAAGAAAVPGERRRLLWDAIPIWPRRGWLARFCAARGAAVVASSYTHSWWFDLDPQRGLDGLAERYCWNTMNRSAAWGLRGVRLLLRAYACDGVLAHWNRSCGIWNSHLKRRLPALAAAGVPCLRLDADMVDPAAFDESSIAAALEGFLR